MSSDPEEQPPRLIAYRLDSQAPPIRPAPSRRQWMDATNQRFAYRCLPMVIANMHGWEVLSPARFTATWDGRAAPDALCIHFDDGPTELVQSHFGAGVLTFHVGYLFRTPPDINLWVKGPTNDPKHGIAPLEGVVETDWSAAPFTMNWRFTRSRTTVRFDRGEVICTIVPLPRGLIESLHPEVREVTEEPEVLAQYTAWRRSRSTFIQELRTPEEETDAKRSGWQRDYFRGSLPDGRRFEPHQTRLKLRPFENEE